MASVNVANTLIVPASSKVSPYYDDFNEDKNFHRIMFRPGYAVQARELTQLQTILQNQVERFGRHIFVNGSSVIGGKLDTSDIITLNVQTQYINNDIDITAFKDRTISYSSGNNEVIARVIQTSPSINGAPACLHVKYITGNEFGPGATIQAANTQLYANLVTTSNVTSNGAVAFIYDSIYFMQGFFIKVPRQAVVLSKHNRQANTKVGLELSDEIITEYDDTSLLDPAQESSNYQAPGAGRYQVMLNLATRELNSIDDEKWIQIATLKNGIITNIQNTPMYSEIEDVLARRTYETNGNYIVKPFRVTIQDSQVDTANNFSLAISPGKAYVFGYEAENQSTTTIEIPRARNTKTIYDYNTRINYGNYVIVDNVQGNFNLAGQGTIDLHCVDAANVSVANTLVYNSTKIGAARIRDLNFYGGSTDVATRQFELYFYYNNFNTITANASASSANQSNIIMNTANTSAVNDAYTGAYIKVLAGSAAGDLRLITDYNGTTKTATVNLPFSQATNTTSKYELRFDITDVDGFVQWKNYTGGATTNAAATISLLNKDDGTFNGNTYISEPSFTEGYYLFPQGYISPGGISNTSYIYRRVYGTVNFSSGNATITSASNEQFEGETTTSNTSLSIMDNFLVIVTNPTGSGRSLGDQVKITATVNNTLPETAILQTGNTSESFTATVYSKMFIRNASPRVKTFRAANTNTLSSSSPSATFVNPTGSTTNVYLDKMQVVIQNPSTTSSESLFISDVIAVPRIYYSPSAPVLGQTIGNLTDVTNRFTLDRGQTAEFYDHATIKAKGGVKIDQGYYIVCCRVFTHTSDTGHFTVDSYPNLANTVFEEGNNIGTGYSLIPMVNGVRMADAIDFRPVRENASNTATFTYGTARAPIATTDFNSDYSYFLERKDIVVMTVNDELKLIQGDETGRYYPETPSKSLLLHRVRVLPYTISKNDISIQTLDYRRYTMADIGGIDRRLRNMEYNVALNFLEKNAQSLVIKDVNGLDRSKYGILAEDFTSHLLGDSDNPDYSCAVDINGTFSPTGGILMPRVMTNNIKLESNNSSSVGLSIYDDKVMLAYTTAPAITQSSATKAVPVADYLFADFRGNIITTPELDMWKDTTTLPPQVASIHRPVIQVDITTNITNTTNNTINPEYKPPTGVDALMLTNIAPNTFANLGQLKWRIFNRLGLSYNDPTRISPVAKYLEDGEWYSDYGTPDLDEDGNVNTTGMSYDQLYAITKKSIGVVGYPALYGTIGLSDQRIKFVHNMYNAILNRPPDFPGHVYWCMIGCINAWDEQTLREAMFRGANQNSELTAGMMTNPTVNLTPKYILDDNLNAALTGDKKLSFSNDIKNYESVKTPEGRDVLATRDATSAVEAAYETYLGRASDPGGLQFWMNQYNQWYMEGGGGEAGRLFSVNLLEQNFKNSSEYKSHPANWVSTYYE